MTGTDFHIPTLTTERLTLRAPRLADFDAFADFRASTQMAHLGGPVDRTTAWGQFTALAGQWALRGYGRWIVADRADDAPLGVVGIFHPDDWPEPEIGWSVFAQAEGRGIAQEAARATRAFAYDTLGWSTIISLVSNANSRSIALAERLDCRPDGTFSHAMYGDMTIWRHPAPEAA
ncbi:GNAT family N-acetyltransferase [Jannaschia pohangensis]|uniref:Ribosomal-protein-alanine N-acetyltransferase n=1 Tax=Jannaschia pohangensis TaxID=390807 RepID=A0A1I3QMM7_9RHOB|nr:GNAT family N-acetyltransferase [Jannaschia pohangensis]SFJ35373.1 ribosomal-protein-alanine N-acetyltransferase [Jannaschia pohangensis]